MTVPAFLQTKIQAILNGGIPSAIFNLFMGRCTFFAIVFSAVGIYGWLHGKDLSSYAIFVGAIQALLVVHSMKEDWREYRRGDDKSANAEKN